MVDFDSGREDRLHDLLRSGGVANNGITVRDYFAAKAMQNIISSPDVEFVRGEPTAVTIARLSYKVADAMMKERDRKEDREAWDGTPESAFGL